VALGQVFSPEYFGFPLSISFHRCSITTKWIKNNHHHRHLHNRVAQEASRLRCVRTVSCGALHHQKKTVFFVHLISEETDLKTESSCWVSLAHLLRGKLVHYANLTRGQQCSILYASYYFRHFNFVLGNITMPRSCKRKPEMTNIAPDTVLRAVRSARIENRSIRNVARDFGIPFLSNEILQQSF
jgi:hypothetical protein